MGDEISVTVNDWLKTFGLDANRETCFRPSLRGRRHLNRDRKKGSIVARRQSVQDRIDRMLWMPRSTA